MTAFGNRLSASECPQLGPCCREAAGRLSGRQRFSNRRLKGRPTRRADAGIVGPADSKDRARAICGRCRGQTHGEKPFGYRALKILIRAYGRLAYCQLDADSWTSAAPSEPHPAAHWCLTAYFTRGPNSRQSGCELSETDNPGSRPRDPPKPANNDVRWPVNAKHQPCGRDRQADHQRENDRHGLDHAGFADGK